MLAAGPKPSRLLTCQDLHKAEEVPLHLPEVDAGLLPPLPCMSILGGHHRVAHLWQQPVGQQLRPQHLQQGSGVMSG